MDEIIWNINRDAKRHLRGQQVARPCGPQWLFELAIWLAILAAFVAITIRF